jgi:apolipoprotein N-acyltransferase
LNSLFNSGLKRFGAALLAGALLHFTVGLNPCWPIAWIAPAPLLVAAFYASRGETRLLAAVASFIGLTSLFGYYALVAGRVGSLMLVLLQMLGWIFIVSFTRAIVRRSNQWFTVLAYPLVVAGLDTLISAFSPHGTFGSLAYTQMNALPVIQVACIAGTPGIVFVISLFASVVAVAFYREKSRSQPLLAYGFPLLIVAGAVGFGALRLASNKIPRENVPIGMVAIDDFVGPDVPREKAQSIWDGYSEAIARLAKQGARIVVLPEKIDVKEPVPIQRREWLAEIARRNDVYLVVGLGISTDAGWKNRAWVFGPSGDLLAEYDKQHLVPGLEAAMTSGRENVVREIDGHRLGVAICKDMHFASLGRSYGKEQVTAVLEPAWDFNQDGWMASRIAALRGVENGYAVVHSARESLLSASDRYGRFVAEALSSELPGTSIIAQVPITRPLPTPYTRFGGWFGWLCVVGAILLRFMPN